MKKDQPIQQKILKIIKLMAAFTTLGTVLIYAGVQVFYKVDVTYYFPFLETRKVAISMIFVGAGFELYSWILFRKIGYIVAHIEANTRQQ